MVASALQYLGLAALVVGAGIIAGLGGYIVGGAIGLVYVGLALESGDS